MHRLVRLFPSMCADHEPICGSFIATYDEANSRLNHLGRRCRASRTGVRYATRDYCRLWKGTLTGFPTRRVQPICTRCARVELQPIDTVWWLTVRSLSAFFRCSAFVRSTPCGLSRYVVSEKDKQPTFTGREQRLGVWILPFLVAGIFGPGRRKPSTAAHTAPADGTPSGPPGRSSEGDGDDCISGEEEMADDDAPESSFLRNVFGSGGGDAEEALPDDERAQDVAGGSEIDQEDADAAKRSSTFDWTAFRRAFPDTPLHAAVTAMFAEYALLVGRITRHIGAAVGSSMTLKEGEEIAEQARSFVLSYVTPILGPLHTTKVHKLLCHLLEAVRLHGAVSNGDTSVNEQQHKQDKKHYARTNKSTSGYTRQLVRYAQGSRSVLRRNKALRDAAAATAARVSDSDGYDDAAADDNAAVTSDVPGLTGATTLHASPAEASSAGVPGSGAGPASAHKRGADANAETQRRPAAHLPSVAVSALASRPGLSCLSSMLNKAPADRVRVPSTLRFTACLPGGVLERYIVRATDCYRGSPWHDHIVYRCTGDPVGAADRLGRVLLLVRSEDGDTAVVAEMQTAAVDDGPLSARGCVRLQWALEGGDGVGGAAYRVRLALVPLAHCRRVVHVVPDFAELLLRRGVGATPGAVDDSADVVHQRFFLNAFFPSPGVRVTNRE